MFDLTLLKCGICGNLAAMIRPSGIIPICCGQEMMPIVANTADADFEKHVPVIRQTGPRVEVTVGSRLHPAEPAHHIEWILLITCRSAYVRVLAPTKEPKAIFRLNYDEDVLAAYAYCNLHGLWRADHD